jgi:hypothetical protein
MYWRPENAVKLSSKRVKRRTVKYLLEEGSLKKSKNKIK